MTSVAAAAPPSRTLDRRAWSVLAITMVFWIADGYDTFALLITDKPTLLDLLPASEHADIGRYIGYLLAITLFGWATGGILGGVVGDRIGRRGTMVAGVVIYSVSTVLSAVTGTWWLFGLTRLFTGIGIGAEWGAGISLLQEVWPERWRTRGAGLLQAGFSVGGLIVSALWVLIGSTYGLSWRWMYLFGIVPLVIVLLVFRRIPESTRWARRERVVNRAELQAAGLWHRFIAALLVSVAITGGWWAVSSYLPTFVGGLVADPRRTAFFTGWAGALYNLGEIAGCVAMGFLADWWGRKGTAIVYFAGSIVVVPVVFLTLHDATTVLWLQLVTGFFTGGLYSWYAIHTPELFPTKVRATAVSSVFSSARYLAMIGSIASGTVASALGGFGKAAAVFTPIYLIGVVAIFFLPETRGQELPE
jgi:MFS family permease